MAQIKNTSNRATKSYPSDDRFMFLTGAMFRPYTDVAEANAYITLGRRHKGLAVLIGEDYYTYKSGVADTDLIMLNTGGSVIDSGRTFEVFDKTTARAFLFTYTLPTNRLIEKILVQNPIAENNIDVNVDGVIVASSSIGAAGLGAVFSQDILAYTASRSITISNLSAGARITIVKQKIN